MRLLLGLILWVGVPCYWLGTIANGTFQPAVGITGAVFAIGMAAGEWTRYQARERQKAAQRAWQDQQLGR